MLPKLILLFGISVLLRIDLISELLTLKCCLLVNSYDTGCGLIINPIFLLSLEGNHKSLHLNVVSLGRGDKFISHMTQVI